jgi:hypothetical protein
VTAPPGARVIRKMKKTVAAIKLRVPRVSQKRVSEFFLSRGRLPAVYS